MVGDSLIEMVKLGTPVLFEFSVGRPWGEVGLR